MIERRYNVTMLRARLTRWLLWLLAGALLVVSTIQVALALAGLTAMNATSYVVILVFFGVLGLLGWRLSILRNFEQFSKTFGYSCVVAAYTVAFNVYLAQQIRGGFVSGATMTGALFVWQASIFTLAALLYRSRMVLLQSGVVLAITALSLLLQVSGYLNGGGSTSLVPWSSFASAFVASSIVVGGLASLVRDKEILFRELNEGKHVPASQFDYSKHLINRRRLYEILEQEVAKAQYYQESLSVLVFDLDNAGAFSKRYGFAINHKTLNEASSRVRALLRATDYFGYWGRESFMVIAPGAPLPAARNLASRLERGVAAHTIAPLGQVRAHFAVSTHHPGDTVAALLARLELDSRVYATGEYPLSTLPDVVTTSTEDKPTAEQPLERRT
ncbi:MAG: diguanylate cyclase [Deinococcota bacterium]